MKFSNGQWMNRKGVNVISPEQAYIIDKERESLTVYAPCRKIQNRANTLNEPLITIKYTSPLRDVIRVQMFHHMGVDQKGPEFQVNSDENAETKTAENEEEAVFESGSLSARINKKEKWKVDFYYGDRKLNMFTIQMESWNWKLQQSVWKIQ